MDFIHDLFAAVWALRWVLTFIVIVVLGWMIAELLKDRRDLTEVVDVLDQENEFIHRRLALAESVDREKVIDFINERPGFITALLNSGDASPEYHRWTGHAEARRQLATKLRLTVPHGWGDHAEPSTTYARVVNG